MESTRANLGQLSDFVTQMQSAKYMANVISYGTLQITKVGGAENV